MSTLRLALLGPPLVRLDGSPCRFDTRKAVALLAYLAVTRQLHRREALAALCWPDADRERGAAALRRTLSAVRGAIGQQWLQTGDGGVRLRADGLQLDVATAQALTEGCDAHPHGREGACAACVEPLARAAELHRGRFLEGFSLRDSEAFDDWQLQTAEQQSRRLSAVLERLSAARVAGGDLPGAIEAARRWSAQDPLHEPAHRQLMRLYAWSGGRAAALRQYRECVRVLDRELGVPPLAETTAVYTDIVEQRLAAPVPASASSPAREAPVAAPASAAPFAGRAAELGLLVDTMVPQTDTVPGGAGAGRLVVVEGEAGIGKSRLVAEALRDERLREAPVLIARGYEGESALAYGVVMQLLSAAAAPVSDDSSAATRATLAGRFGQGSLLASAADADLAEAARLLPALAVPGVGPPPLDTMLAHSRFVDALGRLLFEAVDSGPGRPPGVIYVDDVHWADQASVELLSYLANRLSRRRLTLVLAWRSELVPVGHPLRRLVLALRREERVAVLRLGRLDEEATREIVRRTLPAHAAATRRVFGDTEGVPLLIVEYLAALQAGDALLGDALPGGLLPGGLLPGAAREVLASRLGSVSPQAEQVATTAAVIGRSFDFETVRDASGRSEDEVASALDELLASGLVNEVSAAGGVLVYDFTHSQLRAVAYETLGMARQRLLHRRVAQALEGRAGRAGAPGLAVRVAGHWRAAGDDAAAARWEFTAGRHAASLLAVPEAVAHFETALALGHPEPGRLHEWLGDLRTLEGRYDKAIVSYEAAAALAESGQLAGVERKLGMVHHRQGDFELAEHYLSTALACSPAPPEAERARILADRALNASRLRLTEEAARHARAAVEAAELAEDSRALAQALNVAGLLARASGDLRPARADLERSLQLGRQLADAGAEVAALNNLALVAQAEGDLPGAVGLAQAALSRGDAVGDRHHQAAVHNNLADLLRASGDDDASMAHLKAAVRLFAEIGHPGVLAPEIWKLQAW